MPFHDRPTVFCIWCSGCRLAARPGELVPTKRPPKRGAHARREARVLVFVSEAMSTNLLYLARVGIKVNVIDFYADVESLA